jgi:hypothetical protein
MGARRKVGLAIEGAGVETQAERGAICGAGAGAGQGAGGTRLAGPDLALALALALARIKTLIGRRFHKSLTLSAVAQMLHRHGFSQKHHDVALVDNTGQLLAKRRISAWILPQASRARMVATYTDLPRATWTARIRRRFGLDDLFANHYILMTGRMALPREEGPRLVIR